MEGAAKIRLATKHVTRATVQDNQARENFDVQVNRK